MLAIVAPGQGAQKPGMLDSWLAITSVRAQAVRLADAAEVDLIRLGTTAGADEIKDTSVTQPLVVAAALLAAVMLPVPATAALAGHSVGELAAAALAGVLTDVQAVELAGVRGRAMSRACSQTPTSMVAVLGGDTTQVLTALTALDLVGANVNGAGQIVAAGSVGALAGLSAAPPPGTRIVPLAVAGAFHTHFMDSAETEFTDHLSYLQPADPGRILLTNADGSEVVGAGSGRRYLDLLSRQITRPVRWDKCLATLGRLGVTGVLELPPAGTLVGLVKRELRGVATLALRTPDDVDRARAFMAEHGDPDQPARPGSVSAITRTGVQV